MSGRNSLVAATAAFFKDRPNTWIDSAEFMLFAGMCGWRSRISDCRTKLGMTIKNRQRKVRGRIVSEYQFIPKAA